MTLLFDPGAPCGDRTSRLVVLRSALGSYEVEQEYVCTLAAGHGGYHAGRRVLENGTLGEYPSFGWAREKAAS